jgi:hypothetical protein
MKVKFSQLIFALVICFSFIGFIFAQTKPVALKFDEFDDSAENQFYSNYSVYSGNKELSFSQRIERFLKQLEKEPGATAYVIYYQARINNRNGQRMFVDGANGIKNQISFNHRIKVEGAFIIDGGYREKNTIEFWIAPKNADVPIPKPTLDKSETFVCPEISVFGNVPYDEAATVNFSISTYNFEKPNDYPLTWKISAGEIVRGQGTNKITIKLKEAGVKRVTAFVEVGGLPYPCQKISSATAELKGKLYLTDSFGRASNGDIKARLDGFLFELQNNPKAKGFIIVYGNRIQDSKDLERRMQLINNYLRIRGFDLSRITLMRGGFRENTSSELWLSFDDAVQPIPTPTVDAKFVETPKQVRKPSRRKQ